MTFHAALHVIVGMRDAKDSVHITACQITAIKLHSG